MPRICSQISISHQGRLTMIDCHVASPLRHAQGHEQGRMAPRNDMIAIWYYNLEPATSPRELRTRETAGKLRTVNHLLAERGLLIQHRLPWYQDASTDRTNACSRDQRVKLIRRQERKGKQDSIYLAFSVNSADVPVFIISPHAYHFPFCNHLIYNAILQRLLAAHEKVPFSILLYPVLVLPRLNSKEFIDGPFEPHYFPGLYIYICGLSLG